MARYINAEKIIAKINDYFCNFLQSQKFDGYESADLTSQWHCDGLMKAEEIIMDAPTADVREVVHSHWEEWCYPGDEYTYCPVCKMQYDSQDLYLGGNDLPNFCPNCGAIMDADK